MVTPPPSASNPHEPNPLRAAPGLPFTLMETPKSRKRRLDMQRAKARRAKAAVSGPPSTTDVATSKKAVTYEGKPKKPRVPDFAANEFIRLWHVMVSEEGKDALDRLLT